MCEAQGLRPKAQVKDEALVEHFTPASALGFNEGAQRLSPALPAGFVFHLGLGPSASLLDADDARWSEHRSRHIDGVVARHSNTGWQVQLAGSKLGSGPAARRKPPDGADIRATECERRFEPARIRDLDHVDASVRPGLEIDDRRESIRVASARADVRIRVIAQRVDPGSPPAVSTKVCPPRVARFGAMYSSGTDPSSRVVPPFLPSRLTR